MTYPFTVKHNGVIYPAGKEVPVGKDTPKENTNKVEEVVKDEPTISKRGRK